MLKIKDSRWKEFCDNAKDFVFEEGTNKYVMYHNGYFGNSLVVGKDRIYTMEGSLAKEVDYEPLDTIYDLIMQGFVEKV